MNIEFKKRLIKYCQFYQEGNANIDAQVCEFKLPETYKQVLKIADGFVLTHGLFRFFPYTSSDLLPSIINWNQMEWKSNYGFLAEDLLFIAEDVFGDQYGYYYENDKDSPYLVKFYCEGGELEKLPFSNIMEFLLNDVFCPQPNAFDFELIKEAFSNSMKPKLDEHLSFSLPLIVGGEYEKSNLSVESSIMHLGVLAQMSLKNIKLKKGTTISRFIEE